MAGEKLAKIIKELKQKNSELTDLVYGQVTSVSPLKIKVESRFEVGSTHLMLSQMVRNMTVWDGYSNLVIFRNLQVGDKVRMLRVQKGQMFYVLERM